MIKIKKLTGFMIFLLFGMIFISCGKPSKKDIIDKEYILEVGVSNEIDREFAGKMEHSPTYTIFKATEYKDNDIMVQNLKNGTVKAILSPMLSLENSDYGYYPVYVDNKNYETVYLIYRKDIPNFLKNSFEKRDGFMLNNTEKYSKEKYKDRFSFFSNIEDFEKKIMANEWALVNIAGLELKNSKISIKLDKGNVVIIGKNGKKYLTAEGLPDDRFEIVSENVILDNYTGYEFTHYDRVPDKEMEKYYGNVYEGPKGGTVEIVKKTEDYSFISFELPMNEEFEYKGEGPKIMGGVYDNPSIVTIGDKRYLRADNLEEKRLEIVNDNVILDTKTGYEFGLKNLSKK